MRKSWKFWLWCSVERPAPNERSISESNEDIQFSREELKEVLSSLYRCRDLEISNLWQRSIFLSVFIVLCFTGYGCLLLQIIDVAHLHDAKFINLNLATIALGCLSIMFSLLWIFMAKSSKAWYEVYETAISTFEKKHFQVLKMPKCNIMGRMGVYVKNIGNGIYSTKAGAYSPSRINIAIGQVCFAVWLFIILYHLYIVISDFDLLTLFQTATLLMLMATTTLISCLLCFRKTWIKSGFLSDCDFDKNGQIISES